MATTVDLITNGNIVNNEWVGTGVFDGLMHAVNKNIEVQYNNGRIAGQDYANIYLGGLQAVLQQSIMFVLQKDTNDAQAAEILSSTLRANTQLQDQLLTNAKQRTLLDTEEQAKQYEVDNILPANLAQIQKQTDVAERGMVENELTGIKQRLSIDKDIDVKERSTIVQEIQSTQDLLVKTQQITSMTKEDDVKVSQKAMVDQQKLTEFQNTTKATYEVTTLLPDQHTTNLKQQNMLDKQLLKAKVDNKISLNGLNASNIDIQNKTTREELTGTTYIVDTLTAINNETI